MRDSPKELPELRDAAREHLIWEAELDGIGIPPGALVAPAAAQVAAGPAGPAAPPPPVDEGPRPWDGLPRLEVLSLLAKEAATCTRCTLHEGRTKSVFARGSADAKVVFVGEGPGYHEDQKGEPFVGPAGQLLDKMIVAMGYGRDEVYVCNVVKCLRYITPVLLENGSWERIGRLVRERYAGRVMSVEPDGSLVAKRVIGWHSSPVGDRRILKVSYRSSAVRGGRRATTWMTHDHEVLTRRGWVPAGSLQGDDEVAVGLGLSQVARDVVVGTLLGDGSIPAKTAYLSLTHSRDQKEYLAWKARAVGELGPIVHDGSTIVKDREHLTARLRTRATRPLQVIRSWFYEITPEGTRRKRVPADLVLSPRVFAIWFLDDGHTRIREGRSPLAEIAAHCFSAEERARLVGRLRVDLGLEAYVRDPGDGRIHFGVEATRRASEVIAAYCPPTMRYKLCPDVGARIAFDPSLYEAGTPETLYDRVVVESVTDWGSDKTFFCIDVEDTHNFVTSGGVVHNCRPPENRTPLPPEMAACSRYLVPQVQAVAPDAIVALGRCAAEALGCVPPAGPWRGVWRAWQGVPVMPTYHPAFLLRSPQFKRQVWDDLKKVMTRLGKPLP